MRLIICLSLVVLLNHNASVAAALAPPSGQEVWETYSDTWVATDALGRTLPGYAEVGPPRRDKFIGIFYFLWLGAHGTGGPYDITKILAQAPNVMKEPNNPLWGPPGAPHHWGEPAFGYYLSDDEWVLRRHAQMLSDAGVDMLFFDVTNQITYPKSYLALCRVFTQIRREGGKTPQIAFLTPFGNPAKVVQTLYSDLYQPRLYSDLWFRWEGKPLILADPGLIQPDGLRQSQRVPGDLQTSGTVGQSFAARKPFTAVGGDFPTYHTRDSGMTLSLYQDGPGGKLLARRRFDNVADNATVLLEAGETLPPGTYYLEQSEPKGRIGWWSETGKVYDGGRAFADGAPASGDRGLSILYAGDEKPLSLTSGATGMTDAAAATLATEIKEFFTFRKPQPDYFTGPRGPGEWGWLEVFPQHAFYKTPGVPEQMTVGVAQNAVDGRLGVLSNPRAHGRSFHDGQQPGPEGQDHAGRNFVEQWRRALEVNPSMIFVTGWNEWVAGRFAADAPFHGTGPVNFVDTFNHEYSRDIEPVTGGHGDNYYYQLIDNIRRFKGVRAPVLAASRHTINIDGDFKDWAAVQPEFRDDRFDTTPRNHPGWGSAGTFKNNTGRNDFVRLKVAHDTRFIYFYAQTREPLVRFFESGLMTLFIDTGGDVKEGWEGFDYVVGRMVSPGGTTLLEKSTGGWNWRPRFGMSYSMQGNALEFAIPRDDLGLGDLNRPLRFDFKWMDNVDAASDALNLYRNGDTAPNGRFRYRYEAAAVKAPARRRVSSVLP